MKAKTFRIERVPGFPEYFKGFSLASDGTGFGATSSFRVVRIEPDGTISKLAPVY